MSTLKDDVTNHVLNLDRSIGSFNTLNDLSNKVCLPNKTEDLDVVVSNRMIGINESEILTKLTS